MENPKNPVRRSLKRKLDQEFQEHHDLTSHGRIPCDARLDLIPEVRSQVSILDSTFSSSDSDRVAAKRATHALCELAKDEEIASVIVDCGAVPVLVKHLQTPAARGGDGVTRQYEYEVEKGSAFALGLLAVKREYQHLTVDSRALSHLVDLLKGNKSGE